MRWLKRASASRLFVLMGWGPWVALALCLRVIRLVQTPAMTGWLYVDVARYMWGFYGLALLGGWILWCWLERKLSRVATLVGVALTQLILLFMCFVELAAFNFWKVTGTQLDYFLVDYALSDIAGVSHLVGDSTPWYLFVLFGVLALVVVAAPVALLAKFGQREPADGERILSKRVIIALLSLLVMCWPPLSDRYAFAQVGPSPWYLGFSGWEFARAGRAQGKEQATFEALTKKHEIKPMNAGAKPKNIVFIVLESTRAISVNPYQSEHKTTPFIEELSHQSLWAKRAYAVVPHTSKALVAILCGVEPNLNMPIQEAKPGGLPAECLAKLLSEHGYKTAFFQSATQRFEWREQLVSNMGYEDFYPQERLNQRGFERANYFGPEDAVMLEPGLKWAKETKQPFMMTFLTLTPHHDYLAPRKRYGFEEFTKDDMLNRYLNTLRYVDQFARELIEGFKKSGLYEETIFVIVGDHGEGFNEHGRSQHDNVIYEEGLRVPLVIHDPSALREQAIDVNVNQLDIIPTVLKKAGWAINPAQWRGQDLTTLERERPIRAHCWYNRRCMAQIEGDSKYIYHFENQPDELFDLGADPKEKTALPLDRASNARGQLQRWRSSVLDTYQRHYAESTERYIKRQAPEKIQHKLNAKIGPWVTLLGYDVEPAQGPYRPGQKVELISYYEVHKPIPAGWQLFAHGVDGDARMIANLDHAPVEGFYGLEQWREGQFITDRHSFNLPKSAPKGALFEVRMGLWHKKDGRAKVVGSPEGRVDDKGRLTTGRFPFTKP